MLVKVRMRPGNSGIMLKRTVQRCLDFVVLISTIFSFSIIFEEEIMFIFIPSRLISGCNSSCIFSVHVGVLVELL